VTPAVLRVRVRYTQHGFDRNPDHGASVLLIPVDFPHKFPIWVINGLEWEVHRMEEEGQRIQRWASDSGVYSATADFGGNAVIEGIKPGTYHLVILSYSARVPIGCTLAGSNPTPPVLSRFFSEFDCELADERQVITDTVTLSPGESVIRKRRFHVPADRPPTVYNELLIKVDSRRRPRSEQQEGRTPAQSSGSIMTDGCFIAAVIGIVLFVIAFNVLPQLLRGR
jgi:hypothetical protein